MSTNPNRRPYPPEFRRDAVALYRRSGHSLKDVAEDLGVSLESLRHPNKQLDVDEGRAEGLSGAERDELARLRRENRTLREEREVLRKVSVAAPRRRPPLPGENRARWCRPDRRRRRLVRSSP